MSRIWQIRNRLLIYRVSFLFDKLGPMFEKCSRPPGEPRAVFAGFEGLDAKILAVADAESPREQLEFHLQVAALLLRAVPSTPPAVPHEEPPEAVSYCIVEELRRLEHPARDLGECVQLDLLPEPRSREVRHRHHERGHVLQPPVVEEPRVLEPVGLLDEPYRVLDPPPGQVALHLLPQGLARAHRVQRRQRHHRLLAARPFHYDEMKVGVGPVRESHGHGAVLHSDVVDPVVRLEQDAVLVSHGAVCGQLARKDLRILRPSAPVEQVAVPDKTHDEVEAVPYVEPEHAVAVPAPVADEHAPAVRRGRDLADHLLHLVVLADVLGMDGRPQPRHEGNDLPASVLAGYRHAERVAEVVPDPAPAAVPHLGEVRHLLGVLLLHVGRVDDCERVLVNPGRGVAEDAAVDLRVHAVRRQVPLEPLLRLLRGDVLPERAGYLAHQRVPRGLDPEEHLPQELHLPAAVPELGRKYPQKFPQLLSRSERRCAIIPHVGSPWRFVLHVALYHTRQVEPTFRLFHFRKRIPPNGIRHMPRLRGQKLGIFQSCVPQ